MDTIYNASILMYGLNRKLTLPQNGLMWYDLISFRLLELPEDVTSYLLGFCDLRCVSRVAATCKRFRTMLHHTISIGKDMNLLVWLTCTSDRSVAAPGIAWCEALSHPWYGFSDNQLPDVFMGDDELATGLRSRWREKRLERADDESQVGMETKRCIVNNIGVYDKLIEKLNQIDLGNRLRMRESGTYGKPLGKIQELEKQLVIRDIYTRQIIATRARVH